jgi:hypothetical protein
MGFFKSYAFKYLKNLFIGVGAACVLAGALFKIESWPGASEMLILGMGIEIAIFLLLGILGPDKDYYWEKLYPGLDKYNGKVEPLQTNSFSGGGAQVSVTPLDGGKTDAQLGGMLTELQGMSRSLSSLKALQEVDFSGTKDQLRSMNNFYSKMTEAMADLSASQEDVKRYKDQLGALNKNLTALNSVYGGMLSAMSGVRQQN